MSQEQSQAQTAAQASQTGQAAGVGPEVGGVHSNSVGSRLDLHALRGEYRAALKAQGRDSACSHASQRSKGRGDGPARAGIETPEKVRQLQRTLYRKAKAEPKYRFWSLYGELTRHDLLEHALRLVIRNGGAPGVDGESLRHITATPDTRTTVQGG